MICFLQFFFVKCSKIFFSIKITNNIAVHDTVLLNFVATKTSSDQFGTHVKILPILNLEYSSLIYFLELIYVFDFTSTSFILSAFWHELLYLLTTPSNLSIYTFFDIEVIYLLILFFKVLINLSETTYFFHYVLNTFLCHLAMISLIYCKVCCLYLPTICLVCD